MFFEGKHYDAFSFARKLVKRAKKSIVLVDGYCDEMTLELKHVGVFHDRFMMIGDAELYHFGASLKDLGRQYRAVLKMDAMFIPSIIQRISNVKA